MQDKYGLLKHNKIEKEDINISMDIPHTKH
jgi:hypothetical protein